MQLTDEPRVPDHDSDPAHTPGDGWVGEGGASHLGPATHIRSAHAVREAADDLNDADTGDSDEEE